MPRMWGIRRCAHGEEFFRFREAKRWKTPFKLPLLICGPEWEKCPSLSALWNAMEQAIGKLCRSVSAGIGQIGHEWKADAWQKTTCGSLPRRPPAVLPPPPFPSAPHSQSTSHLPPGGTPLSEGGECSRALHSPNSSPRSFGNPPRPLSFPKNQSEGETLPETAGNASVSGLRFPPTPERQGRGSLVAGAASGAM
jgi:hypothetical protein